MRTLAAAALALASCTPAFAQPGPPCAPARDLLPHLESQYGEIPVARGLSSRGSLTLLVRSPDGATWSLIVLLPDGRACLADSGEDWQAIVVPAGDPS